MALGNDEQMDGRLGIKILEGEYFFVVVFDLGRTLPGDYAAEDTAGGHIVLEVVYTRLVGRGWRRSINEGDRDGYLPQVQTQDPQEREPRQARVHLVPQDVSRKAGPHRKVKAAPAGRYRVPGS